MTLFDIGFLFVLSLFGMFAVVVFFGAPYLPTLKPQVNAAFELAKLQPGMTLLELGCGDGRVLFAAAEQGARGVGYELNPLLVLYGKFRALRYRGRVTIHWANFWTVRLPEADVIYVFLLDKYMEKLDKKIIQSGFNRPVTLVSVAFQIPDKKPKRIKDGVFAYRYNA